MVHAMKVKAFCEDNSFESFGASVTELCMLDLIY